MIEYFIQKHFDLTERRTSYCAPHSSPYARKWRRSCASPSSVVPPDSVRHFAVSAPNAFRTAPPTCQARLRFPRRMASFKRSRWGSLHSHTRLLATPSSTSASTDTRPPSSIMNIANSDAVSNYASTRRSQGGATQQL